MKLLSTKEAAQYITKLTGKPISPRQVSHEIKLKYIKATKIGHSYAIEESALKNYTRRHTGKQSKEEIAKR